MGPLPIPKNNAPYPVEVLRAAQGEADHERRQAGGEQHGAAGGGPDGHDQRGGHRQDLLGGRTAGPGRLLFAAGKPAPR
jgi:hypothetical protein